MDAIILAGGLWASTQATGQRCQPLPDGRGRTHPVLGLADCLGDGRIVAVNASAQPLRALDATQQQQLRHRGVVAPGGAQRE